MPESQSVTELLPKPGRLPLRGLYLDQRLQALAAQLSRPLTVTTFLTDSSGVIATTGSDHRFHVPLETRNESDWRLSQELMAQADVIIVGGSYLRRAGRGESHPQDILFQFEPGGEFEDLGEWRLDTGFRKRSPDVAIISRHLDFEIPGRLLSEQRKSAVLTTDGMVGSAEAERFRAAGVPVIGRGKFGVEGQRVINYLHTEMEARVICMASGPRVLELLLQASSMDLIYITQVQRAIAFDDPSTVLTLLPNGKKLSELKDFRLTHEYRQEEAVAGDGAVISQLFLRYDYSVIADRARSASD